MLLAALPLPGSAKGGRGVLLNRNPHTYGIFVWHAFSFAVRHIIFQKKPSPLKELGAPLRGGRLHVLLKSLHGGRGAHFVVAIFNANGCVRTSCIVRSFVFPLPTLLGGTLYLFGLSKSRSIRFSPPQLGGALILHAYMRICVGTCTPIRV